VDANAWRDAIAADLAAALGEEIPVTTDPATLNPPAVLVAGIEWGPPSLDGCTREATLMVYVVASPPADDRATRWCLAVTPRVMDLLGADTSSLVSLNGAYPADRIPVSTYVD